MKSNNSPRKVVSRLLHNTDYFKCISPGIYDEEWKDIITEHKVKCRHEKCELK
jgi:hypothetical protein